MVIAAVLINFHETAQTKPLLIRCLDMGIFTTICLVNCAPNSEEKSSWDDLKKRDDVLILETETNLPYGMNFNIGLRNLLKQSISYDFIFQFNSDVFFSKDAISECTSFMRLHPNCGLCAPVMKNPDGSIAGCCWDLPDYAALRRQCYYFARKKDLFKYIPRMRGGSEAFAVDAVRASFMCVRRAFWEKCGGFYENRKVMYNEENFLSLALKKHGFMAYILPNVFYVHNHFGRLSLSRSSKLNRQSRIAFARDGLHLPAWKAGKLWIHSIFGEGELFFIVGLAKVKQMLSKKRFRK